MNRKTKKEPNIWKDLFFVLLIICAAPSIYYWNSLRNDKNLKFSDLSNVYLGTTEQEFNGELAKVDTILIVFPSTWFNDSTYTKESKNNARVQLRTFEGNEYTMGGDFYKLIKCFVNQRNEGLKEIKSIK